MLLRLIYLLDPVLAALCVFIKSKRAMAIHASDAGSILAVVTKQRQDSPWESCFCVCPLFPPVGPSLLVTHGFSRCATAASLTNFRPLSL